MSLRLIKIMKISVKITSRGVSEASRDVLWRLVASRGVSLRRLVASRGVSWRLGAKGSFLKRAEGVCPACKGESTTEVNKSSPRPKNRPDRLPGGSRKVPGHPRGPPRNHLSTIFGLFLRSFFQRKVIVTFTLLLNLSMGLTRQISRQLRTFVRL